MRQFFSKEVMLLLKDVKVPINFRHQSGMFPSNRSRLCRVNQQTDQSVRV